MNIDGFSATMKTRIANLREDPNSTNLEELINEEEILSFTEQILKTSNTMSQITISYIKEVGNILAILALVSSVRESATERHLQAERVMLPDVFLFGHPKYGQYLTYRRDMLSNIHLENHGAWEELVKGGFGRSLSNLLNRARRSHN